MIFTTKDTKITKPGFGSWFAFVLFVPFVVNS